MKTLRNIVVCALLAVAGNALADELRVQPITILPGEQTDVAVELENPDRAYIMTEFYMSLPEGVSIAKDEDEELLCESNGERFDRTHSLVVEQGENGTYHFLIYSSKNKPLKGNSGALLTMTLEADANATQGQFEGRIFGQVFSDENKTEYNPADITFTINVGQTETVTNDRLYVCDFDVELGKQSDVAMELENPYHTYIMTEFYMSLPAGVSIAKDEDGELLCEPNSERFDRTHSLVVEQGSDGTYHFLIYSSKNKPLKGSSGVLLTMTLKADANATPGQYEGRIFGQVFSDEDRTEYNPADVTFAVTVTPQGLKGDVNQDGAVDIADVVAVYNIMAGNNSNGYNGDVNADGATDIADVVAIYNIMAGGK